MYSQNNCAKYVAGEIAKSVKMIQKSSGVEFVKYKLFTA